jgi:hypothetical protein
MQVLNLDSLVPAPFVDFRHTYATDTVLTPFQALPSGIQLEEGRDCCSIILLPAQGANLRQPSHQ